MTEEEAKTKWCPMAAIASPVKTEDKVALSNCIASDCMMWTEEEFQTEQMKGAGMAPIRTGRCGLTK